MKYLITFLSVLLIATAAQAEQYCRWDGTKSASCKAVRDGVIKLPSGLSISGTEANYNSHGYYKVSVTEPTLDPATQKVTGTVEAFDGSIISRSYTVGAKTAEDLNGEKAQALSYEMYIVLKWLKTPGAINTTTGNIDVTTAPVGLKDAYLARQALGQ